MNKEKLEMNQCRLSPFNKLTGQEWIQSRFLILLLFLIINSPTGAHARNKVLIFYSANEQSAILATDAKGFADKEEALKQSLSEINPDLDVESMAVNSLEEILTSIASTQEPLRGVIFLGHGNAKAYALNSNAYFGGKTFARKLYQTLSSRPWAERLLIYFSGCMMGKSGESNFQERFFAELQDKLPDLKKDKLDVVAHSYLSNSGYNPLSEPGTFERLAYRTGIGPLAQRISVSLSPRLVGSYSFQTVHGLMLLSSVAVIAYAFHGQNYFQSYAPESVVLSFAGVIAHIFAARSPGYFGRRLSLSQPQTGSIADLLREGLESNRCESVFRIGP